MNDFDPEDPEEIGPLLMLGFMLFLALVLWSASLGGIQDASTFDPSYGHERWKLWMETTQQDRD